LLVSVDGVGLELLTASFLRRRPSPPPPKRRAADRQHATTCEDPNEGPVDRHRGHLLRRVCPRRSTRPDTEQSDGHNEETVLEDQHFCCHSVDPKTKSGEGCNTIGPNQIDACAEVLVCPGFWAKHDRTIYCE
jgi:hypothetical protein